MKKRARRGIKNLSQKLWKNHPKVTRLCLPIYLIYPVCLICLCSPL
ncbi:hypothetical protein LOK49_LG03G01941 [Camellia lanceoleosa]|uniref:Uncharacterized protein n=1 Tax=Camellia lanceoleosa TaxID=1840588 RepID=A0ACC0IDK0_9ERIC|nr:hypothetical protein LOK49_LG03G01941 [Camellia lanceoleosa]